MKSCIRFASLTLALTSLGAGTMATHSFADDATVAKQSEKPQTPKAAAKSDKAKVGAAAPAIALTDTEGKSWSLADAKGKVVVLQWVNPECPVSRRVVEDGTVAATLKGVREAFPDAVYVGINSSSSRPSSFEASKGDMAKHNLAVPVLIDTDASVCKLYGAKTTPQCFVIDAAGVLVYSGAIDDSPSGGAKTNYVVDAVQAIKAGKPVSPSETKPYGCGVKNK